MSVRGLSDLIVTIMAAGEVAALPARELRALHEVLASLHADTGDDADAIWLRFGGRPPVHRDADVQRRVEGVTDALWDAVTRGMMTTSEDPDGSNAEFVLGHESSTNARRRLLRLPVEQATSVYRTGASLAAASTARKKAASSPASSASTRRVRLR